MKRLLASIAVVVALATGIQVAEVSNAPTAEAAQIAEKCRHHSGPDGAGGADADICVMINLRDTSLQTYSEALSEWHNNSPTGTFFEIRFFYIRYLRIRPGGGSDIVEAIESNVLFDSRFDFRYSTDWYDHCTRQDNRTFYGLISYQVIWHGPFGTDTGPTYGLSSYQEFLDQC